MKLIKILQSQGFGSRREIEMMIRKGLVKIDGIATKNDQLDVNPEATSILVNEISLVFRERVVVALNKPAGYECSHNPQHHKSIFELLPSTLINRQTESAGRLDADTTGLLILTDDGSLIHSLMSPKKEIEKTYRVTVKHPVTDSLIHNLREGVTLHDSPSPVQAINVVMQDSEVIDLTITEGKYHQVKRMIAAAGNRVEQLQRIQIGGLKLSSLMIAESEFIYLEEREIAQLFNPQ